MRWKTRTGLGVLAVLVGLLAFGGTAMAQTLSVAITETSVNENDSRSGREIEITVGVKLVKDLAADGSDQTVKLSVGLSGTAEEGADYSIDKKSVEITFEGGQGKDEKTKTVDLNVSDDAIFDGDTPETVVVTLTANLAGAEPKVDQFSIVDDDVDPNSVSMEIGHDMIYEDRTKTTSTEVTVKSSADVKTGADNAEAMLVLTGTATEGQDYIVAPATVKIGEKATITTVNDATMEGDETILINVSLAGTTIDRTPKTITIKDDDGEPVTDPDDPDDPTQTPTETTVDGAPGQVMLRSAYQATTTTIYFSWQEPGSGDSPLVDYQLEYMMVGGDPQFRNNIPSSALDWTIGLPENDDTPLTPDTIYNIRLRAQNKDQAYGLWSEWLPATTKAVPVTPDPEPSPAVSKVAEPMVEAGDMMLMVSWSEPASEKSISHYQLDYKTASATKWMVTPMNITAMEKTIEGLINGTAYLVRVRAVDGAGNMGEWSDNGSGTPMAMMDEEEEPMPTPALPIFGAIAMAGALATAGRRRMRQRQLRSAKLRYLPKK